jgi:hypothetical protein
MNQFQVSNLLIVGEAPDVKCATAAVVMREVVTIIAVDTKPPLLRLEPELIPAAVVRPEVEGDIVEEPEVEEPNTPVVVVEEVVLVVRRPVVMIEPVVVAAIFFKGVSI